MNCGAEDTPGFCAPYEVGARRAVRSRRAKSLFLSLTLATAFTAGCGGGADMAARLANAAVPAHLPFVKACWEKEFEAAQFSGETKALVAFTLDADGRIHDARVKKLMPGEASGDRDFSGFKKCLEDALNNTELPRNDDENGPGFNNGSAVAVDNFLFAFTGGSTAARKEAESRSDNVLIGPRADRCQGLYTYDPPRGEVDLYTAVAEADAAWSVGKSQPEQYARYLQKAYDLRLELLDRLRRNLAVPDLPDANRKKLKAEIESVAARAKTIGDAIGCKPAM
ncbi:MAG: hypothetical protein IPK82_27445 [Polyangiaceae bacterium]|nr:hypothetical protein [Polyangiaceae bacterium]